MNRRRFLCLTALAGATSLHAQPSDPSKRKRVLFIGNSYTYVNDLPTVVAYLLSLRGIELEQLSVTPGGTTLEMHWNDPVARMTIGLKKWDFVVLQEQSVRPIVEREAMFTAARLLHAEIAKAGAKTLLYETWAAKAAPDDQGKINDAYDTLGRELGATVVPVGEAWTRAIAAGLVLHGPDGRHPNPFGSYLAACLFARAIGGEAVDGKPPKVVGPDGETLNAGTLEKLQRLAVETWKARAESGPAPARVGGRN